MKKKKIVDTIISSISDCWMIQRKKGKIFIANCVQSSGGITRIFVCPMRHEIVGGSKDGRIGYFSFSFGIVKFIKICKSHDIIVKDLVLLSRGKKQFEFPTIVFEIKSGRSNFLLHLFTAPPKSMNVLKKIKVKNHRSV
jgi:hypothetical protein